MRTIAVVALMVIITMAVSFAIALWMESTMEWAIKTAGFMGVLALVCTGSMACESRAKTMEQNRKNET